MYVLLKFKLYQGLIHTNNLKAFDKCFWYIRNKIKFQLWYPLPEMYEGFIEIL